MGCTEIRIFAREGRPYTGLGEGERSTAITVAPLSDFFDLLSPPFRVLSYASMPPSLSNRRRKAIAALTRRRARRRTDQTLIEGRRALQSAIDAEAPLVDAVVTHEALDDAEVQALLDQLSVPVYVTDASTMDQITDVAAPQGLVAIVERRLIDPATLPGRLGDVGTALLLDGVQDPGNAGTLLRTASWFGAQAVVAGPGTAGLHGPKVMRAAAGGHWALQLARADSLGPLLERLRRHGVALYGADLQGVQAHAWTPDQPSALALGSEAHGLSAAVLDRLDLPVALPGTQDRPAVESLNVAVAGGILLYEWLGN